MSLRRRSLTPRQNEIYEFVREQISGQKSPPTIPEIADHFGLRSTNGVYEHLVALEAKGYIERKKGKARGITLTERIPEGTEVAARQIPIVGEGNAANPFSIFMRPQGLFTPDPASMPSENAFAAVVADDGMEGEGIFKGDLVIVTQGATPVDGNLVFALEGDSSIVRRFEQSGPRRYLAPSNRRYERISYVEGSPDLALIGVVGSVVRKV
mgnify:CR=1 FL=1